MRLGLILICIGVMLAACQPAPPTVVYVVITDTPGPPVIEPRSLAALPTDTSPPPTSTPLPLPTEAPSSTSSETFGQIQVAEQVFENGRMFWLQPYSQIWVLVLSGEGGGEWLRYTDTFDEAVDIEASDEIEPPEGFYQPRRGFGKLWRQNPDVRDALGWGITPEFGYISEYRYQTDHETAEGDSAEVLGRYEVLSLNGEAFCLDEQTERWQLGC